ncbi:response regulator [Solemya elarraichensis gill symbiont]|uniref:Response regulatory domain-containing protein n=1 Tax=Solemya elarraichensis gill symbiont TaxID=1918949 RepID=A0A1T2LBI5_9GAMM|nr:response regulator [Solemya elarraichensis gill symbiont]OOZ42451.1 hypothetical protein BOW52_03180 [Solemya elarraichensis gill symbiont]
MHNLDAKILVVDDDIISLSIVLEHLKFLGLEGIGVNSGVEALELLKEDHYAMILTDINMPMMDGCEMVRNIREEESEKGEHKPILAITSYTMPDDIELYHESGIDGHLAKPISMEDIDEAIKLWLYK